MNKTRPAMPSYNLITGAILMRALLSPVESADVPNMIVSPYFESERMLNFIHNDPKLSSSILAVINSPLFDLPEKVVSVDRAVYLLGISQIIEIISNRAATSSLSS